MSKLPAKVSRWELAGIPAALVFEAAHRLGWLELTGVSEAQLPSLMVMVYCIVAGARAFHTRRQGGARPT